MARRIPAWFGPSVLLLTGIVMLAWTWRAWPDPIVDFGRELYVPWRLSEGDRLHADVAWINGPLSQHWNALLFRLFGPGLSVLAFGNLAVLAACVILLYRWIARLSDRLSATAAGLTFLLVFAFGQQVDVANYNWITPYSHELTHGIALGLGALAALDRWSRTRSLGAVAVAGFLLGACFLTKAETFLAAAAASAVFLAPAIRARRGRELATFAAAGVAPVSASLLLVGLPATLGAWPTVLAGDVAGLPFHRFVMGLDQPARRLSETVMITSAWGLAFTPAAIGTWFARTTRGPLVPVAVAAAELAMLVPLGLKLHWFDVMRPLPLFTAVAAAVFFWQHLKSRPSQPGLSGAAFAAFGLVLLGKMILNARTVHYGFALAMPATLVAVTGLVGWLPAWLDRRGGRGDVLRVGALVLLSVFAFAHVRTTARWLQRKTTVVGERRDAFRSDARGTIVNGAISAVTARGATSLAVLPEGVGINYLTRVPNPTPHVTFLPGEALAFGEQSWLEAFRAAPPDVILLIPTDTREHGLGAFGDGYGRDLVDWIRANYRHDGILRTDSVGFQIRVLKRKEPPVPG